MGDLRVKYKDSDDTFSLYCNDDSGDTELGPVKWDDANNKFEANCDSTDHQIKYDDANDVFESQSGDADGCCEITECPGGSPENGCNSSYSVTISGFTSCTQFNTTQTAVWNGVSGHWIIYYSGDEAFIRIKCQVVLGVAKWQLLVRSFGSLGNAEAAGIVSISSYSCPPATYALTMNYGCSGDSGTGVIS